MLSFLTKINSTKALTILSVVLAIGLTFTILENRSLRALNAQTKSNLVDVKQSLADVTRYRDEFQERYDLISGGVELQRRMMEEVRSNTSEMIQAFGKMSMDIRTDVGLINGSLNKLTKRNLTSLTCDQAIELLRQSAMDRVKE